MSERWLGAAFYFPLSEKEPRVWLTAVAEQLGEGPDSIIDLGSHSSLLLRWGGLDSEARCVDGEHRRALLIRYLYRSYFEILESSKTSPPAAPLIEDFIRVCNTLRPELALIVRSLAPDLEHYVASLDELVAAGELERIVWTRPGAVYVSNELGGTRLWEYPFRVVEAQAGLVAIAGLPVEAWT
jgi:hypothetical protein